MVLTLNQSMLGRERARGKRKGKNTLKVCVISLLLFGQSKSMATRKAVNLIGQIYFDRMTGPPLVKETEKRSNNWLALSDRSFLPLKYEAPDHVGIKAI